MKRLFLITLALTSAVFTAAPAHAKNVRKSILPPSEFDHPYEGKIRVIRDTAWSLPCRPRSLSTRLGCAYPPDKTDDACVIYLAEREEIEEAGYTENTVWRHEVAVCNGWRGYRPLFDTQVEKQLEKELEKELEKVQKSLEKDEKENPHQVYQPDQGYRPRWD
jgi:hypothetical protein